MTTSHSGMGGMRNVSLAEEDAVKEIVAATVMNLWEARTVAGTAGD